MSKLREDLALAAFAVAHGFTLRSGRSGRRGEPVAPCDFDAVGIPHDGLCFQLGRVEVWDTARGWRVAALEGEGEEARYPKPQPHEFHGKLINALRAAIAAATGER